MNNTFVIDDLGIAIKVTTSKGNQAKYMSKCNTYFVKERFFYQNKFWEDNKVECLASSICSQLDIKAIQQGICTIDKNLYETEGTYSYNFLDKNELFITKNQLLNFVYLNELDLNKRLKKNVSISDRCLFDLELYSNFIKDENEIKNYLLDICLIDFIILNEDRHDNNYGLIYNEETELYRIPELFDFGIGAFEHDLVYNKLNYNRAIDKCKMKNYSSNPIKLFNWLRGLGDININKKISKISRLSFSEDYIPNTLYTQDYFWVNLVPNRVINYDDIKVRLE